MQGPPRNGARLLAELATLFASLTPAKRQDLLHVLRDAVAALDDPPDPAGICNPGLGRASL